MPTERLWEHASVCVEKSRLTTLFLLLQCRECCLAGIYPLHPAFTSFFLKLKSMMIHFNFNERLHYILSILLWWGSDKPNKRQRFTWEYSLSGWEQSTSHLSAVSMINGTNKWPSTGCFCIVSCFHLGDCAFVFLRGREGSAKHSLLGATR